MLIELLLLSGLYLNQPQFKATPGVELSSHAFSLENRYGNTFVNGVFKDNILLTLGYMDGTVKDKANLDWNTVYKPFHYEFTLNPGEEFAFHDGELPNYSKNVVKTTNVHFNSAEGFKSDGYLVGDGVCHLASLLYWVAKDAGLETYAPSNHNFANIPDVPREYGVAIQAPMPLGNLYIVNSKDKPVTFTFDYEGTNLTVKSFESL